MRGPRFHKAVRLALAALLGAGAAVLVACGSAGKGLIPTENAGPLENDFQAVAQAAQEGDGNCTATETAIGRTERDLRALPSSVDAGLRGRLEEGVVHLSARARALCAQPLSPSTSTTETTATSTTKTPPSKTGAAKAPATSTRTTEAPSTATTETTSTAPTGTTPTSTTSPPVGTGGGAQAPGNEEDDGAEGPPGKGPSGNGPPGQLESGEGGGTGVGR